MKCGPARVEGPPSQGPNTMALEDGSGPRASSPRCQTSPSEHRRNQHVQPIVGPRASSPRCLGQPSLNQPMKCGPARVEGPPSQGPNTMALKDGSGPRASSPRCQTSPSEHRRNQLRTFPKPAPERWRGTWGRPAGQIRPPWSAAGAGRGTPLAGPKHHGPGGRIGPAGQQPTVPNVTFWTP